MYFFGGTVLFIYKKASGLRQKVHVLRTGTVQGWRRNRTGLKKEPCMVEEGTLQGFGQKAIAVRARSYRVPGKKL